MLSESYKYRLQELAGLISEATSDEIYNKYYKDISLENFNKIVEADPFSKLQNGKVGRYAKWLLKLFRDKKLLLEDLYKATEYLKRYDSMKHLMNTIETFGSLPDLKVAMDMVGGTGKPQEDESYLINDRFFINKGDAELFFEDSDWLVVIPRTLKASQFYGEGSEWCTTAENMFEEYSSEGNLYEIIDKKILNTSYSNRRMQWHLESHSFMDIYDKQIDLRQYFDKSFAKKLIFNNKEYFFNHAVNEGYMSILKSIIGLGVDINNKKHKPGSFMINAVKKGRLEVIKLLIDNGADVNVRDKDGNTTLSILIQNHASESLIKLFIDIGVDVNVANNYDWTPLHYAAETDPLIVQLLIKNGASIDEVNDEGKTPLFITSSYNNYGSSLLLIRSGANVNHLDNKGNSPLLNAIRHTYGDMVKMLIENGANPNLLGKHSETPLVLAVIKNVNWIPKLLIDNKADVNLVSKHGDSALFNAVVNNNYNLTKLLIDNGANVNFIGGYEESALSYATSKGFDDIAQLLIKSGAKK